MSKERICNNCTFNNNGWCSKRKTNKGLKDLTECEYMQNDRLTKLKRYYDQKKFEYECSYDDFSIRDEGILKGLEIAIKIMSL